MTEREYKVAIFLTSIAKGELTVEKLKQLLADAEANPNPCPTPETLTTIAAAKEAVEMIEAEAERIEAERNN